MPRLMKPFVFILGGVFLFVLWANSSCAWPPLAVRGNKVMAERMLSETHWAPEIACHAIKCFVFTPVEHLTASQL